MTTTKDMAGVGGPIIRRTAGAQRHGMALLMVLCLTTAGCGGGPSGGGGSGNRPFGIEVIVRTSENFHSAADVQAFVDEAAKNGVIAVNLLVKQDEDAAIASGQVFYASSIAPRAAGYATFDVLQAMLNATHGRNIKVRAWVPQFHDQVAATKNPAWQMMAAVNGQVTPYTGTKQAEYFANPLRPEVQAYELSILAEITANYAIDGIMLDWIRFDNFNMDLSDYTRQRYQSLHGVDPATIDFAVDGAARAEWNAFRTDGIAAYVHDVRQQLPSQLLLGVYILPPEFVEVGQDAGKFNPEVSSLAPMCYFNDWGYPIDWLWSSCLASTAVKAGEATIVPAMDSKLTDAQYQQIFAHLRAEFPQVRTIAWFYHGTWTAGMLERIGQLSRL